MLLFSKLTEMRKHFLAEINLQMVYFETEFFFFHPSQQHVQYAKMTCSRRNRNVNVQLMLFI